MISIGSGIKTKQIILVIIIVLSLKNNRHIQLILLNLNEKYEFY